MPRRARTSKDIARDIGIQSIHKLYVLAVEAARRGEIEYSRALLREADEIRRLLRLAKPVLLRRGVCRNCWAPLVLGLTARVRLVRDGRVTRRVVTCLICGYKHRYIVRVRRYGVHEEPREAEGNSATGARRRNNRQEWA
ncbi:MAG TPA: ribonuclease P [Pyrodictium delaneyi]|uniref:Ribonuclease P protein component 4 n=1 Tax=Pyrodictium delaneyi TaxID=1273541 RepID=A0A832ZUL3_9CREN|nr:ribonuclease P [Pyrodictium delaneyi]